MELGYNAFLFNSVPIKRVCTIVSIKVKHFTILLSVINCKWIHKLLCIFMLPCWELYEYVCTDHRQKQTIQWQWGTRFKGLQWLHKTSINALRVAWKAIKKPLIDLVKEHWIWQIPKGLFLVFTRKFGQDFGEILMKNSPRQRFSPVAELGARLWCWRRMAAWCGRRCSGGLHGTSGRRGDAGGWIPHVGPVWRGHQLRRGATEVLNRGRSMDSWRLIEPRGWFPRTGSWGIQVI